MLLYAHRQTGGQSETSYRTRRYFYSISKSSEMFLVKFYINLCDEKWRRQASSSQPLFMDVCCVKRKRVRHSAVPFYPSLKRGLKTVLNEIIVRQNWCDQERPHMKGIWSFLYSSCDRTYFDAKIRALNPFGGGLSFNEALSAVYHWIVCW
jgi:hypothetical protein